MHVDSIYKVKYINYTKKGGGRHGKGNKNMGKGYG